MLIGRGNRTRSTQRNYGIRGQLKSRRGWDAEGEDGDGERANEKKGVLERADGGGGNRETEMEGVWEGDICCPAEPARINPLKNTLSLSHTPKGPSYPGPGERRRVYFCRMRQQDRGEHRDMHTRASSTLLKRALSLSYLFVLCVYSIFTVWHSLQILCR